MEKETLGKLYGLQYDKISLQTSLVKWHNRLVDKTIDDLDAHDVERMVRQKFLIDVAVDRAIELFISNPFDGEYTDGGILALLVSRGSYVAKTNKKQGLIAAIRKMEDEIADFEWDLEKYKVSVEKNLPLLEQILNSDG